MTDKTERRKFLKAALAAMATAGASTMSCRTTICYYPARPPKPDDTEKEKSDRREELTEQLKKLAEEEPPKDVSEIGPMCYAIYLPENLNFQ